MPHFEGFKFIFVKSANFLAGLKEIRLIPFMTATRNTSTITASTITLNGSFFSVLTITDKKGKRVFICKWSEKTAETAMHYGKREVADFVKKGYICTSYVEQD